ncbi:MAG TPA: VWA domain-containing protein, partial [Lacipirellulaceae bacterium]|nr:VWA domain-containing protein [Lacipirellulaceae bacterium]
DAGQIAGLGPSIDALLALLRERKRKILERFETGKVSKRAARAVAARAQEVDPPKHLRPQFHRAVKQEQIRDLERLWYAAGDDNSPFARTLLPLVEALGDKYQVEQLCAKYEFTGREPLTVPQALEVKEELERIDELIRQLEEARETAQIGVIDMDALAEFAEPGDIEQLSALQQQIQDLLREAAERQGLQQHNGKMQLTPQAYRVFQGKLLERLFSELAPSRTGRHSDARIVGEGAVELQATKPYEFGDSIANLDVTQSFINALVRNGPGAPVRLGQDDLEIHRTRNAPKCATCVLMDMSGSMRYDGQYINVKRMALALEGLIRREYPGDYLQFVEIYSFAKPTPRGRLVELMPKPVTVFDPIVRLKADMSRDDVSEHQVPPHFTNLQHGLATARRMLATQDTPNKQIVLITDGLPTAHFEGETLYLLYPPDLRTEQATLREGQFCRREGITINLFLLPSWSQSEEDVRFAYRLAESTLGRVFFTAGRDLDRYVVWDYLERRRDILR